MTVSCILAVSSIMGNIHIIMVRSQILQLGELILLPEK